MRKLLIIGGILIMAAGVGCQNNERDEPDNTNANDSGDGTGNTNGNSNENDNSGGTVAEQGVAELKRFESAEELETFFKEQIQLQNDRFGSFRFDGDQAVSGGGEGDGFEDGALDVEADAINSPEAPPTPGGDAGGSTGGDEQASADQDDFSGTTLQELGVDESDVVKTDGEFIYVLNESELRIIRVSPVEELGLVSTYSVSGYGQDLYLLGDRVVALTHTYGAFLPEGGLIDFEDSISNSDEEVVRPDDSVSIDNGGVDVRQDDPGDDPPTSDGISTDGVDFNTNSFGTDGFSSDGISSFSPWFIPRPQTIVTVIDVADRGNPTRVTETIFDGSAASSRMIDGVLRLVLANQSRDYYDILPLGAPIDELRLPEIELDAFLPDFVRIDADGMQTRGNVVEWDDYFRPVDADGFGVTTIVTLDSATPDSFEAVAIMAQPGLIYASTEAMYMTDTAYFFDFRRVTTDIYKFAYTENSVELVAAGAVPGRILNQYSMGEHDGFLRIAASTDQLFNFDTGDSIPSFNAVYVMGQDDDKLDIVGQVSGIAPGELIQSARFLGDRGYVVTFKQIDPFFTLDLADPTDPKIVGELKIPGFSSFITPMGENHLLSVGVYVDPDGIGRPEGVQLSIFDVTEFDNPIQAHNVVIGNQATWSEANGNPKAFNYFAQEGLVALPIQHQDYGFFEEIGDVDFAGAVEVDPRPDSEPSTETRQPEVATFAEGEIFQGLFIYSVSAENGFTLLGKVDTKPEEDDFGGSFFTRGVFIAERVFGVTDRVITASPVANLQEVSARVEFPSRYDFTEPGIPEGAISEDMGGQTDGSEGDAGSDGEG